MAQMTDEDILTQIQDADRAHHLHPFTDPGALRKAPPFVIEHAEGCYITGQNIRLLDAMAGLGCVNVGYGRREIANAAADAMERLAYYHSFAAVSNPYAGPLAAKIAEYAPAHMNKVFFANSGSEANETLIKLVRLYWARKGEDKKRIIISRDYAYHGSTIATTLLNGNKAMLDDFGLKAGKDVIHAMAPFWYRLGGDMSPEEFGLHAARDLEAKILEAGPENVAAFWGEPIQGTLGAVVPPTTYWPEVERICRKYDVLLVADEVVTGFGRTGNWFAQETLGFKADMMALAKGLSSAYLPISAAVISDEIANVIEGREAVLQHGFTTSGHPVTAAVALKNIEILENEGLVTQIANDTGPYFARALKSLEDHPLVGEARVSGLMAGIELAKNKETREQYPLEAAICEHVGQAALMRGLIVRPVGNVLVLCPPFILNHGEIDFIAKTLREALDDIQTQLG
ncbi:aminotransferase [Kordiimonas aestuarii]|uniref:aminotransferase n=1 Tax=Kordiimonas aestuarii TaxID=1005925 RepID=UPI0021D2C43E|nr:aminotransferase [Kordiimonas aestuarii]